MIEAMVAAFGLCIGSFLNVVIYRVPRKIPVYKPMRSFCPTSGELLSWWENIPVLSYLILRGKSRHSKTPISGVYPLVEIITGLLAVITYAKYGLTPTAAIVFLLSATLVSLTFIDLEFRIIPNVISFPGMIFGLLLGIASQYTDYFGHPITQSAFDSLLGFLCGGGFFYAISWVYYVSTKRVGLGGGDIKLMAMLGAILGVQSVVPIIFASSVIGSVVGIVAAVVTKGGRHTEIAFGPYLAVGALLYIFADISFFRIV